MVLLEKRSVIDSSWARSVSLYAIDKSAMIVENRIKRALMRMVCGL